MAYEKTTWNCGDTITAEKLNNLEDGVAEALECCGGGSTDTYGWDIALYLYDTDPHVPSSETLTVAHGSYAALMQKIENKQPISGFVDGVGSQSDYGDVVFGYAIGYLSSYESNEDFLLLTFKEFSSNNELSVLWYPNDTVVLEGKL